VLCNRLQFCIVTSGFADFGYLFVLNFFFLFLSYCRALQLELAVNDDEGSQFSSLTENVVGLRVVNKVFKAMMVNFVSGLRRAGLMIDTFGLDDIVPSTTQTSVSPSLHKPLSNPVTVLCNDIQLAMRKLH